MENQQLRNGEIGVHVNQEQVIWKDRKRTFLGLPWSFTRYSLTPSRLIVDIGLLNRKVDEIRLYRIKDISYHQTLGERIVNVGCIRLVSSDASLPEFVIRHVKNAAKVKEVLSQSIEVSRHENGVRTSELVGGGLGGGIGMAPEGEGGPAVGPGMFPDFNHDGIDDRTQN